MLFNVFLHQRLFINLFCFLIARRKIAKSSSEEEDNNTTTDEDEPRIPHPAHFDSPMQVRQKPTGRAVKKEPRNRKPSQEQTQSSEGESGSSKDSAGQYRSARSTRSRIFAASTDSDDEFQKPAPPTRSKCSFDFKNCIY